MTFKHSKFEDSPIMRSLEKVAREKGLVKEEPIAKTASAPAIDLTPSDNLMSNILKLCAGLRAAGFGKYASELELSYLGYKKANTLYETSKEKGEDLIDAAHPKGGTKLDIEGDHVVETILNNHLKMVDLINKKPTGKLATSKDILGAVKTVLAQEVAPEESEEELSRALINQANKIIPMVNSLVARLKNYGGEGFDGKKVDEFGTTITGALAKSPLNRQQLNVIADTWKKMIDYSRKAGKFGGEFGSGLVPWQTDAEKAGANNWNTNIAGYLGAVLKEINQLAPLIKKKETIQFMKDTGSYQGPGAPARDESNPEATAPRQGTTIVMSREATNIFPMANNALQDISRWQTWLNLKKNSIKSNDYNEAMKWLKEQSGKIQGIKDQFTALNNDPERQNREAKEFASILNTLIAENKEFKEAWFQ